MRISDLPHKNLFVSGLAALVILIIGFYVNYERTTLTEEKLATQDLAANSNATSTDISTRDSDGDTLLDWEERLYGSDPFKADTDGDGTPDGEEVRLGRNPAVANTAKAGKTPNDFLKNIQDPHFATSSTDILGLKKEFFAKFLAQQSKDIREITYRNLLKGFDVQKIVAKNQLVDLNISSDNSIGAMREYGNAFGVLIKKYTEPTHRTEQAILADGMKAKSDAPLAELQLPAIAYKNFSSDLKVLKVPSSLAQAHLLIVNGYEAMSKGLLAMQSMFSKPMEGAGGYEGYTSGRVDVTQGYAIVVSYFSVKKVVFSSNEPGYPFYVHEVTNAPAAKTPMK